MASNIDPTKPVTGNPQTAEVRSNFSAAKTEIEAVQDKTQNLDSSGNLSGGQITVADNVFTIQDNSDATKQAQFQASGITAGQTRTLTIPDASTTLVGTDATQTLSNKTLTTPTISGGTIDNAVIGGTTAAAGTFTTLTVNNTGLHVLDTDASHDLILKPGSNLTADRTLTLTTGDADRTLTLSADVTLDQDVDTTAAPSFATGVTIGNLTLADGSITDSSGALSFGDEDLTTTGGITVGDTLLVGDNENNKITISGSTFAPNLTVSGSDTNIDIGFTTKGTGGLKGNLGGNPNTGFVIDAEASYVNGIGFRATATGKAVQIRADASGGSDTNLGIKIVPKGTGVLELGYEDTAAGTPGNFSADRIVQIKDDAGNSLYIPAMTSTW